MSSEISITCSISSGKIKCRYKQGYTKELIPKGEPYINIETWDAGGAIRVAICKKHARKVNDMFDEAMKDLYIRKMTGI